ncbi:MAG: anthranilate synthase component I [Dehalococcoidia bacterium]|nr:anthranilate synthase component I [Dehalococcoidia bacterium]
MYSPTLEEVKSRRNEGNLVPIYREIVADLETPVSAFLKISHGGRSFLLESVEGGQWLARYSFIGTDPYLVVTSSGRAGADPFAPIAQELAKHKIISVDGLPRFTGGAVGYLSYETAARFEDLPTPRRDPLGLPESQFMFVDTLLVFDHVTHRIKVCSHVRLNGNIEKSYQEATHRIDALVERLRRPLRQAHDQAGSQASSDSRLIPNFTREDFEACVAQIKEYITAGEAIQVVLSQRFAKVTHVAPLDIYRALRTISPSPYMFFFDMGDFCVVGASPEILLRVEGGNVITRPLAGTRPRGKNPEEDARLEQELRSDEKERAEHIMLVDLGRNDIGRVSEAGSVEVSDLMDVEKYSHVMHLVTHVQGKLRQEMTPFDALRACFPAGTVSGAPKIRAMQIIAELEPEKRGIYAGAVGYFSFTGNMDMAIAIRTIVMKNGVAYVQTGCGVVYDSVPQREYEETQNKARGMLKAIEQAESSA